MFRHATTRRRRRARHLGGKRGPGRLRRLHRLQGRRRAGVPVPHPSRRPIDAAAAHPGTDLVWIAMDQDYTDQHIVVADQDVVIEGGFTDCFDDDPAFDQTTIERHGRPQRARDRRHGQRVRRQPQADRRGHGRGPQRRRHLFRRTGRPDSADGVGLPEPGRLRRRRRRESVRPDHRDADRLRGFQRTPRSCPAAASASKATRRSTVQHSTDGAQFDFVTNNHALGQGNIGYGGGIEVLGPAVANLAAVVAQNDAPYGAGIAALATEHGGVRVNVYATNPGSPGAIYENTASGTGGGVFLKPYADMGTNATLCARNFSIHSNTASNGAAIYADLDGDKGSGVLFNSACDPPPQSVACAAGVSCNTIHDNNTLDGSTVLVQSKGFFAGDRFEMRHNVANSVIGELTDAPTLVTLSNCLLADNNVSGSLIEAVTPGGLDIASRPLSTAARWPATRSAPPRSCARPMSTFGLSNSIVDQPGKVTVDAPLVMPFLIAYVLSNDVSTLPPIEGVALGEPTFVDAANGDYHLQPISLGVDFAPTGVTALDLDGLPRTVDHQRGGKPVGTDGSWRLRDPGRRHRQRSDIRQRLRFV